jgi:hypothetical protein
VLAANKLPMSSVRRFAEPAPLHAASSPRRRSSSASVSEGAGAGSTSVEATVA